MPHRRRGHTGEGLIVFSCMLPLGGKWWFWEEEAKEFMKTGGEEKMKGAKAL